MLKEKINNEEIREKFTPDKVANFFTHFLSGNEFYNNLQAADFATSDKVEVREKLKVKDSLITEELSIKKNFNNKLMSISENQIIFDDEADIRLKDSPIKFKTKDIFEIIAFLKFMIKTCGQNMEKCQFDFLTKDRINLDRTNLINQLKEKFKKMKKDFSDFNKSNIESIEQKQKNSIENSSKDRETLKNLRKENKLSNSTLNNNSPSKSLEQLSDKNNFKDLHFKEMLSNKNTDQAIFKIDKDIESEIELEFSNYKENNINDYENFLTSPFVNEYAKQYYYGTN
jgi:hypothetical protein